MKRIPYWLFPYAFLSGTGLPIIIKGFYSKEWGVALIGLTIIAWFGSLYIIQRTANFDNKWKQYKKEQKAQEQR